MLRSFVVAFLLFFYSTTYSQYIIGGSYFIAAICKDGIVIGADTRQSIYNFYSRKIIEAYYDTSQKIYTMNKYAVALMGEATILMNRNWKYYYVQEIRKSCPKQTSLKKDIDCFFSLLNWKYGNIAQEFLKNMIVFAGYDNDTAKIGGTTMGITQWVYDTGYLQPDKFLNFETLYNRQDSCNEMGKKIERAILDYAKSSGQSERIGGLITILKISPKNEFTWLSITPYREGYLNQKELYEDYINGKVDFHFKSEESKKKILEFMKSN